MHAPIIIIPIILLFCYHAGSWELIREHTYYYQVQAQLNVANFQYGDFVVWTENGIAIERIKLDRDFYENCIDNIEHFFVYSVLPEIVGKWYTRQNIANEDGVVHIPKTTETITPSEEDMNQLWCYCGEPSYGDMIMCEHDQCTITWFHFDCLRIRGPPKGKWYCPSCRKLAKVKRKKKTH